MFGYVDLSLIWICRLSILLPRGHLESGKGKQGLLELK